MNSRDDEGPWDFALPLKQTIYKPLPYEAQSSPSTEDETCNVGGGDAACDVYKKPYAKTPRVIWFTPHPKKLIKVIK